MPGLAEEATALGRERHTVRLVGWVLAANAVGLLVAVTLAGPARDAVQRLALLCGVG